MYEKTYKVRTNDPSLEFLTFSRPGKKLNSFLFQDFHNPARTRALELGRGTDTFSVGSATKVGVSFHQVVVSFDQNTPDTLKIR